MSADTNILAQAFFFCNEEVITISGYSNGGASQTKKSLRAWQPRSYSSVSDIDTNLKTLRHRAKDLAINSAVGAAAIQTFVTNVIGNGLKIFPKPKFENLNMTAEKARQWSRHVKDEFNLWATSLECDFLRRNNFYELQAIAFGSMMTDGDCFGLLKRRSTINIPYTLKIHLIDAQRVSNPQGEGMISNVETVLLNGNRIVSGIEVNPDGMLVAIHVSNRIFDEPSTVIAELKWQRVEFFGKITGCRNVLHVCKDTQTDQFRGVPLLAPVVSAIKNLERFSEAELSSAIIKSYFSIFFTQPETNRNLNQIVGMNGDDDEDPNSPCVDASEYKLGSATLAALPRGVDVKAVDSQNAQSTFESFTNAFLTQIASAIGLPYELLLKKFQSSYSASRAALLQAQDTFRQRKSAFVNDFCQPIYEQWLAEAVALGRIDAPGFFDDPLIRSFWTSADWYSERSGILDPLKDAQAVQLRLALGLSTREKESAELNGSDFWDNVGKLSEEARVLSTVIQKDAPQDVRKNQSTVN